MYRFFPPLQNNNVITWNRTKLIYLKKQQQQQLKPLNVIWYTT